MSFDLNADMSELKPTTEVTPAIDIEAYKLTPEYQAVVAAEQLENTNTIKRSLLRRAIDYFNSASFANQPYVMEILIFSEAEIADMTTEFVAKGYTVSCTECHMTVSMPPQV